MHLKLYPTKQTRTSIISSQFQACWCDGGSQGVFSTQLSHNIIHGLTNVWIREYLLHWECCKCPWALIKGMHIVLRIVVNKTCSKINHTWSWYVGYKDDLFDKRKPIWIQNVRPWLLYESDAIYRQLYQVTLFVIQQKKQPEISNILMQTYTPQISIFPSFPFSYS